MKKTIFCACVLFFVCFFCGNVLARDEVAAPAPNFKLRDLYQDTYTLSQYKGKKPVILLFWTTWCPLCEKEIRIANEMYAGFVQDGFEFLAVNVGELPDRVRAFVKSYHLGYKVLLDKDTEVAFSFGLIGVPVYVFVDKEGNMRFKSNYFSRDKYNELLAESRK